MKPFYLTIVFFSLMIPSAFGQEKLPCPESISVSGPTVAVVPGDNFRFIAHVARDSDYKNIGYVWTVDGIKEFEGQGTSEIKMLLSEENVNKEIFATVRITGLPMHCRDVTASGSAIFIGDHEPQLFDEIGEVRNKILKSRVEAFLAKLESIEGSVGFIVFHGKTYAIAKRRKSIKILIQKRKFDPSRIVFVDGENESVERTRFWVVRPGSDPSSVN